jgi:hypothetical protein
MPQFACCKTAGSCMGKAEQYRHYAAECIRLAQQTPRAPEKDMLLSMAAAWRRLAEHAERTSDRDEK